MEVVDIHPHVISDDEKKYPINPLGGKRSEWSKDRPATTEELVRQMDEAGISCAALVQSSTTYGHDNTYAIEAAHQYPTRFETVCSIDLLDPNVVETLDKWYAQGMKGIRLFTTGSTMTTQGDWLGDERSIPGWKHTKELGIPVCVQMKQAGIPLLEKVLAQVPDVVVILDHLSHVPTEDGYPYKDGDAFWNLARHPNVYLKMTLNNFKESQLGKSTLKDFMKKVFETFGSDRLAWGSNFPANQGSLKEILEHAQGELAYLPQADQENIFSKTALKLYPGLKKFVGATA